MRLLRPYAVVINGELVRGVELLLDGNRIVELRPHTGLPDPFVISPAFVNAHSHLEYRGMLDSISAPEYAEWIRELTQRKAQQTEEQVRQDCLIAADENRKTGVAWIGEHSDRPGAAEALTQAGIRGILFQEVITFFERKDREAKLNIIREKAAQNATLFTPTEFALHAYQTVDRDTLSEFARSGQPLSIHVAETEAENQLTLDGSGPLGDFQRQFGFEPPVTGKRLVPTLQDLGLLRDGVQFVHCCAINADEVDLIESNGVGVAHCPRSNQRLKCPIAPIRELLDAGADVGLGLDSAASSGPIDMFAEMRACIELSLHRGKPVSAEETWRMATTMGYRSFGNSEGAWDLFEGSEVPLIAIHVPDAHEIGDLIESGSPASVEWI